MATPYAQLLVRDRWRREWLAACNDFPRTAVETRIRMSVLLKEPVWRPPLLTLMPGRWSQWSGAFQDGVPIVVYPDGITVWGPSWLQAALIATDTHYSGDKALAVPARALWARTLSNLVDDDASEALPELMKAAGPGAVLQAIVVRWPDLAKLVHQF